MMAHMDIGTIIIQKKSNFTYIIVLIMVKAGRLCVKL